MCEPCLSCSCCGLPWVCLSSDHEQCISPVVWTLHACRMGHTLLLGSFPLSQDTSFQSPGSHFTRCSFPGSSPITPHPLDWFCWRSGLCPSLICSHPLGDLISFQASIHLLAIDTQIKYLSPMLSPDSTPIHPAAHWTPALGCLVSISTWGPEAAHIVPSFCSLKICPISGHDLCLILDSSLPALHQHQRASPNRYPKIHPESDHSPPPLLPSWSERHICGHQRRIIDTKDSFVHRLLL